MQDHLDQSRHVADVHHAVAVHVSGQSLNVALVVAHALVDDLAVFLHMAQEETFMFPTGTLTLVQIPITQCVTAIVTVKSNSFNEKTIKIIFKN